MTDVPLMAFLRRPVIAWQPLPSPRRRVNRCGICCARWPALFDVPDTVWRYYIEPAARGHIICLRCWDWLTDAVDGGAYEAEHGGPVPLWSPEFRRRHGIPPDEPSPWDGSISAPAPAVSTDNHPESLFERLLELMKEHAQSNARQPTGRRHHDQRQ